MRAKLAAALLVGMLTAGCATHSSGEVAQGRALDGGMQSTGRIGTDHAQLGEVFWAALPLPRNASKDPVVIEKARFTQIPKGLKVGEYRVFSANEVGGIYFLAYTGGKYGTKDPEKFKNYAGQPIHLKGKQESDYYYAAKVTVTGPVHDDLGNCSFWYEQNNKKYKQKLHCQTSIRIGKPLPDDD
jgi:hypothetical protein